MTDALARAALALLTWLAAHPTVAFLLTVCIQVGLIAAAAVAADRLARGNAVWSHRIWLSAVVLVLSVVPLHAVVGGWPIHVSVINRAALPTAGPLAPLSIPSPSGGDTAHDTTIVARGFDELPESGAASETPIRSTDADGLAGRASVAKQPADARQPTRPVHPSGRSEPADLRNASSPSTRQAHYRSGAVLLTGIYLLGCSVVLVRLAVGAARLARWSRCGRKLHSHTWAATLQAAQDVGLRTPPRIRAANEVVVPLVFGVFRPAVLVPADFDRWTADEQRATLLHELMHIRRRDMIGQLMAQAVRAVYWFHPASQLIDRRLTEARERATDQQVVALGMQAGRYAASLLSIVARAVESPLTSSVRSATTVAMSASSEMEVRLKEILEPTPPTLTAAIRFVGPGSIALLVLVTALSTVRVERVVAQDDPPNAAPVTRAGAPSAAAADNATNNATRNASPVGQAVEVADASHLPSADENNLFGRFQGCDVLNVSGETFEAIFTVSGQVVSPEGQPVEGAVVLLRESSTSRISSESRKYLVGQDRHRVRTRDVFARTVTDANGRFEFREVKSPAMPSFWSNSWRGDVVAARDGVGVGWLALEDKKQKRRVDSDLTIVLRPTTSISGRFVSPGNVAIEGAIVSLNRFIKPTEHWSSNTDLDLQMSQLAPRTRTDADGRFVMAGIPQGYVATVSMSHPEWYGGNAAIATSANVPLGRQEDGSVYLGDRDVVASPAEVIADPGVAVDGRVVDADGNPIPGVAVSYASSISEAKTDDDGRFHLLLATSWVTRDRENEPAVSKLLAKGAQELGFLSRYHEIPVEQLAAAQPVTIELEKGVWARGSVTTDDGLPMAGALLHALGDVPLAGGTTDAEGNYALLLPQANHTIVVTTDEPGYRVPGRSDLYRSGAEDNVAQWPHARVDLSDGIDKQVPTIAVSRTKPVQVIATLPDGRPATGATAIIKDELARPAAGGGRVTLPPMTIERSDRVMTNQLGRAELLPQGVATDKAFLDIQLAAADQAFGATVPLSQAVDGVVSVVLTSDWIVEGRVLIDGRPVAGALVAIGRSTPMPRGIGGASLGRVTSNFQHVVTDTEGWYRASAPQGHEYSVRVQSLPDETIQPAIGYRAAPSADGRLRVRDFAFFHGNQEIAGRVVDLQGKPVSEARVQVLTTSDSQPEFWIGHGTESQFQTDRLGRFHLRKVPAGAYRLSIHVPRNGNQARSVATMVTANAGQMDVQAILDAQPLPETPRLQPRRVEPVNPSQSQSRASQRPGE